MVTRKKFFKKAVGFLVAIPVLGIAAEKFIEPEIHIEDMGDVYGGWVEYFKEPVHGQVMRDLKRIKERLQDEGKVVYFPEIIFHFNPAGECVGLMDVRVRDRDRWTLGVKCRTVAEIRRCIDLAYPELTS